MKTVAFVSTMYGAPWGGSEELWFGAAARMKGLGYNVSANIIKWPKRASQYDQFDSIGIRVHERLQNGVPVQAFNIAFPQVMFRWLDRVKPDFVVISQGINIESGGWMQACLDRKIPYVTVVQCACEHLWPDDGKAHSLAQRYTTAEAVYFVSERNIKLTETQLATRFPNAEVVRNPFNVDYQGDAQWPPDDGRWRLACVGRLAAHTKGQDLILNVMSDAKWKARPLDAIFYGTGQNEDCLHALAKMNDLQNVRFAGHVSDVGSIWRNSHALLVASRFEGLPLVIVEAMLCGRPCIVTDVAGNTEFIEDGVTGFVAEAATERHLDRALEQAWSRRHEWQQMGHAATRHIRKHIPNDPIGDFVGKLQAHMNDVPLNEVQTAACAPE